MLSGKSKDHRLDHRTRIEMKGNRILPWETLTKIVNFQKVPKKWDEFLWVVTDREHALTNSLWDSQGLLQVSPNTCKILRFWKIRASSAILQHLYERLILIQTFCAIELEVQLEEIRQKLRPILAE